MRVCSDPGPATAHPVHISAVTVHCTAAGALLLRHRVNRHARQQWRSGGEQDEERNEAGEPAHRCGNTITRDEKVQSACEVP